MTKAPSAHSLVKTL